MQRHFYVRHTFDEGDKKFVTLIKKYLVNSNTVNLSIKVKIINRLEKCYCGSLVGQSQRNHSRSLTEQNPF